MKAIDYRRFGSPDVLELEEVDRPTARPDEVLVRVRAAGLNPFDWHFVRGEPLLFRPMMGLGVRKPRRVTILGSDVAGVAEAPAAMRHLKGSHARGKVAITVRGIKKEPEVIGLLLVRRRGLVRAAARASLVGEAVAAVDRLRAAGAEGDLGLAAAAGARRAEHLAWAARIAAA